MRAPQKDVLRFIRTRYLGPSNTRPWRVVATVSGSRARVVLPWQHGLDAATNHRNAAEALARKLAWLSDGSTMFGGTELPGYVWVFVSRRDLRAASDAALAAEG
jgi:hypothetical protein